MRECIYCGKQLEKGEVCNCSMSIAKRKEREVENSSAEPDNSKAEKQRIKNEKKEEKKREKRAKREAKQKAGNKKYSAGNTKNALSNSWQLIKNFIRSPIETLMNPGDMGKAELFILVIAQGIIGGLCSYSIITGASRGPFSFLGNILGFKGMAGYGVLLGWLMSGISGAASGTLVFFLYSGIFYLVNRFIFKQFIPYWEFARRFAFVALPISAVGIIGIVLGMFSQNTFALLLISGAVGSVILTYELLRTVWYDKSPSKTMLTMMICIFIFLIMAEKIVDLSM